MAVNENFVCTRKAKKEGKSIINRYMCIWYKMYEAIAKACFQIDKKNLIGKIMLRDR